MAMIRDTACDICGGESEYPAFCWRCYGTGRIPLIDKPEPRIWSTRAVARVIFFTLATFMVGVVLLARRLGWL